LTIPCPSLANRATSAALCGAVILETLSVGSEVVLRVGVAATVSDGVGITEPVGVGCDGVLTGFDVAGVQPANTNMSSTVIRLLNVIFG
jgi:hypothetical protein